MRLWRVTWGSPYQRVWVFGPYTEDEVLALILKDHFAPSEIVEIREPCLVWEDA